MPIEKALNLSQEKKLDLVEIVAKINPPVVRICDYSKLLYQQEKAERKQRIKERSDEMKHIRLSFNIGKHDMEIKARQAEDFLKELKKHKTANAFYASLNKTNKFAINFRLQTAKKPETRVKRMQEILAMLKEGKKFH